MSDRIEGGESRTFNRDGISKTARQLREHAARNGHHMTQEAAEARVCRAVRYQINIENGG